MANVRTTQIIFQLSQHKILFTYLTLIIPLLHQSWWDNNKSCPGPAIFQTTVRTRLLDYIENESNCNSRLATSNSIAQHSSLEGRRFCPAANETPSNTVENVLAPFFNVELDLRWLAFWRGLSPDDGKGEDPFLLPRRTPYFYGEFFVGIRVGNMEFFRHGLTR